MPISKVVYGNNTLIDLTGDTVTASTLGSGITAHTKSGSQITGTAPILYNSNSTLLLCRKKIMAQNTDVPLINFGSDKIVYMRISGANILLVSTTSGGTESTITVASPTATYVGTFYVSRVHYINRNQALIQYRWETTAAGVLSRNFVRLITLKNDGTLVQSSQINGSDAPSATVTVDGWLIPMYEAKTSFMLVQAKTTISTGAIALFCSRIYANLSTGALTLPSSSAWVTLAASNASTKMSNYFDTVSEYGTFAFYDGANTQNEIDVWCGYSGTNKDVAFSAAGDINSTSYAYLHVLGKLSNGNLLVMLNNFKNLEEFEYDPITCYFTYKNTVARNGFQLMYLYSLPQDSEGSAATVYDGYIHVLGGIYATRKDYSWKDGTWTDRTISGVGFQYGCAVTYNGAMYLIGGEESSRVLRRWYNQSWSNYTLPYAFYYGSAVVYDNKIHILGSYSSGTSMYHYAYNGGSWSSVSTLPFELYQGCAVVYNNKIHIMGSGESGQEQYHYAWDGTSWVSQSTLPYAFTDGCAVVYDDKIHILGGNGNTTKHYAWNGTSWVSQSTLPFNFACGCAVVYENKIHIMGSYNTNYMRSHYDYSPSDGWKTDEYYSTFLLSNDIIVNSIGQCYQITQPNAIAKPVVENLDVVEANYLTSTDYISHLSDPFQGVFIY